MNIDLSAASGYQIVKIHDELSVISELSELRFLISGYLSEGKIYIAVSFTNISYIYSGAIAVLIDCYKKIKNVGGNLCIIESNPQILAIFRSLNLDKVIEIYPSVNELPAIVPE
jgi:anti-sigma B factor antagonist